MMIIITANMRIIRFIMPAHVAISFPTQIHFAERELLSKRRSVTRP